MTRDEHLALCKKRALEYLDRGDMNNAVTSMLSDLTKHSDTKRIGETMAGYGIFLLLQKRDSREIRKFIEGFN